MVEHDSIIDIFVLKNNAFLLLSITLSGDYLTVVHGFIIAILTIRIIPFLFMILSYHVILYCFFLVITLFWDYSIDFNSFIIAILLIRIIPLYSFFFAITIFYVSQKLKPHSILQLEYDKNSLNYVKLFLSNYCLDCKLVYIIDIDAFQW